MNDHSIPMPARKRIALVAHDARKHDRLAWVKFNRSTFKQHDLFATGPTGRMISESTNLPVFQYKSGPLGVTCRLVPALWKAGLIY